jgi:hypothetical protein
MPYRLTGTVLDGATGAPLAGLLVRGFDKDFLFDDALGDGVTDAAGCFEIVFTEVQFRDHGETAPDLYVRVYDATGTRLLHSTRREARKNSLRDEHFELRIDAAKSA